MSQENPLAPTERILHLYSDRVQKLVNDFCLNTRHWSSYPMTNIEVILKFYAVIPPRAFYKNFDPDTNELVFREVIEKKVLLEITEITDNESPKQISNPSGESQ